MRYRISFDLSPLPWQYAVQVLDLVRSTLPMVLEASRQLGQGSEEGKVYSDTKHRHYAVIETDHPYKQACVTHHKVITRVLLLKF